MCVNVGSEYGIVLLSTVRSRRMAQDSSETADTDWIRKNLGFVADPHRICVGITRCKFGLVIVGELILLVAGNSGHQHSKQVLSQMLYPRSITQHKLLSMLTLPIQ